MNQSINQDLEKELVSRRKLGLLRKLEVHATGVDFTSNDYLGLLDSPQYQEIIQSGTSDYSPGSSGSRLLSGNLVIHELFEKEAAKFHQSEAGLAFNSGYDANLGLIQGLCREGDVLFSDELNHASIIDGIRLAKAEKCLFKHHDLDDLEKKIQGFDAKKRKWILVEAVYSMDGDICPLEDLVKIAKKYQANILLDEAHSGGVYGPKGEGLAVELGLQKEIFARVMTFGKAWGNHGAIVLGSSILKEYLVNFSRSFIYSTSSSPKTMKTLLNTLKILPELERERANLRENIQYFREKINPSFWINSSSSIQSILVPGNEEVRKKALKAQESGFIVKPIVYPTVSKGKERIRICLKANHSKEAIQTLIKILENES